MELDDLKNTWRETKNQGLSQQNINLKTLENMNNQKYRSRMKKIIIPEIAGSIVCLIAAVFIGFNFHTLNTVFLQGAAICSVLLLLLLPVISTLSTWGLSARNLDKPYAETLKAFALQKIRFIKFQKLNLILCYVLLVCIIILVSKFLNGRDLSGNRYFWIFSFTLGYIFLLYFSKWVEKYYRKNLQQAEELLNDLSA